MKPLLKLTSLTVLALSVLDFSIIDSDGDRSKNIVYIHYSDGTSDRLVVPKDRLDSQTTIDVIEQIIAIKTK